MRKVRIFEFLCPKKHSKIRTGSVRNPPVSLLSLKHFFHTESLAHLPHRLDRRRTALYSSAAMHYKVLFRIEKFQLIAKLQNKLTNYQNYCKEMGDTAEIEIVFAGDVVQYFRNLENDFTQLDADIALCHNALSGQGMEDIQYKNIRTVRAGIGEIIKRKAEGFIEYTIE